MPPSNLRSAVEALLFSSDQPLTLPLLADALETPAEDVSVVLASLGEEYAARDAGVTLREMSGGWVFMTAAGQNEWVTRMLRGKRKTRLSRAALETMAIIAYKQPVTKSEVEAIRGVDASGVLATLLERNLVTIKGRSTVIGRPLLYGTTPEFLNYFGLRELSELPRPEELRALVAAREPEQLEMMELDPQDGMPLTALALGEATAEKLAGSHGTEAPEAGPDGGSEEELREYSIADADAAIALANAARADAAMAMAGADDVDATPAGAYALAGDLEVAGDAGPGEDEDEEYDEDDDEEDEYDDDEDGEDDEDEADDEDAAGEPSGAELHRTDRTER